MKIIRKLWRIFPSLLICLITALCCSNYAFADLETRPDDGWHFLIAPYGWASSVEGDATVKNRTSHIHVPFRKILKYIDFAAEAHVEAGYGPLTLMIDPTYLKLSKDVNARLLNTQFTINAHLVSEVTLIDGGVFYRILSTGPATPEYASLELLGGARYLNVSNTLTFARISSTLSTNIQLTAPIVGARLKYDPTPRAHLWLRGDVGGFGVDNVKSTWSSTVGFAYTVYPHIDLGVAYRVLDIHFTTPNSTMNVLMYGPMIGIGFHS
ncbi:MAG: hypothetical protein WBE18_04735 [Gammaproteobacteria bacterium]